MASPAIPASAVPSPGARRLVLASASPRRREFFRELGYVHEVVVPRIQEHARPGEKPLDYVRRNAAEKAADVAARVGPDAVVVSADTIVVLGDEILEKPHTPADAHRMLRELSGGVHQVMTGLCVRGPATDGTPAHFSEVVVTDVEFKPLSEAEIDAYIATGEPMDKAGAYGIQGLAAYMIRAIRGSYTNVVGLPMAELSTLLTTPFGFPPRLAPAPASPL